MTEEVWCEPLAMDSTWTGYGLVVGCSPDMHEEAISIPSTTGNKVRKRQHQALETGTHRKYVAEKSWLIVPDGRGPGS